MKSRTTSPLLKASIWPLLLLFSARIRSINTQLSRCVRFSCGEKKDEKLSSTVSCIFVIYGGACDDLAANWDVSTCFISSIFRCGESSSLSTIPSVSLMYGSEAYINMKEQLFFSFVSSLCCNSAMKEKWWSLWVLKSDSEDQVVQWVPASGLSWRTPIMAPNLYSFAFGPAAPSVKCNVGSERSSVQGLALSRGADCSALVFRGELQEERWAWGDEGGHAKGGPDSNSFCLFTTYFSFPESLFIYCLISLGYRDKFTLKVFSDHD